YLESIRRRFSESEGRDEIVNDIEGRLGELIHEGMGSRTIVMLPDVEAAVVIMGKPEDFGGEPAAASTAGQQTQSSSSSSSAGAGTGKKTAGTSSIRPGKRLFRDEEDAVVGGVCSGLAAYFGIGDPLWVRLSFVILGFASFGFWAPAYILLWIIIPPAKSAADRLAMRGEPINVDNIAKEIEDGFERLSHKVEGGAYKSATQNAVSAGVSAVGQTFAFVVRFFIKFWAVIALFLAAALFVALITAWVAGVLGLISAAPYIEYFSPLSAGGNWVAFTNIFFLLGIPLVGLTLAFARAVLKVRTPAWLGGSMGVLWGLNLASIFFLASTSVRDYRRSGTLTRSIDLSNMRSDTLRVEGMSLTGGTAHEAEWWFDGDGVRLGNEGLHMDGPIEIRVKRSPNGSFECVQNISAHAKDREEAVSYASRLAFNMQADGNRLRIPTSYLIPKGERWRGHKVRINIFVPEGKYVTFDDNIYRYAAADMSEYSDRIDGNYISRGPKRVFRMASDGLECADCPKLGDREYKGDEDYEHFILEGDFKAEIRKGDDFKVRIEGPSGLIQTIRTGEKITFTSNGKPTAGAVTLYIETPTFTSLYADNTGDITLRGFDEGRSSISMRGGSVLKAFMDSGQLGITLNGKCRAELVGDGNTLEASLANGAELEATNWRTERVEVSAADASRARVYASEHAQVRSDASSQIKVDGTAEVENR
ncbi:MAG TPA: PspC domain-containing protein, partial [Saprospiraceae bacterium]|nr:PspC domain-containing protein [Saprospiraceae bacterium]